MQKTDEAAMAKIPCKTILVVDDDRDQLDFYEFLLKPQYLILTAMSGQEALEVFKKNKNLIGAIVTDNTMIPMTGTELLRKLRLDHETVPVVMITADHNAEPPASLGLNAFLRKPFEAKDLDRILKSLL
jgi:two-component system, cell cycle sensor histidine kinase and response regulator CckA